MLGIDISFWNGVFNWSKAKQQGADLVWLRASGCGNNGNYEDYRFKENSASCSLTYNGAYHYFDYRKPGADQAKFFLDTCGDFGNLRGVLDLEDNSGSGWAKLSSMYGTALKYALEFVNQYKLETGHLPAIYISSYLTTLKDFAGRFMLRNFHECPLWVAHYINAEKPYVLGWKDWAAWQYSSNGDGVAFGNAPGNVWMDLNRINNLAALLKPGITSEDEPVVVTPALTESQKVDKLWEFHPELH